jgi:hypothetical protein
MGFFVVGVDMRHRGGYIDCMKNAATAEWQTTQSEQAGADHACDTCGGSGWAEQWNDGPHTYVSGCCPACQGSGRISDVMPARDAMADAETLVLCVREWRTFEYTRARKTVRGRMGERIGADLFDAVMAGGSVRFQMSSLDRDGYAVAREAASHALRAVPGLRG